VTGPNTVVDAIAAGAKAARVIDRYLRGEELREKPKPNLPSVFIPPADVSDDELQNARREEPASFIGELRKKSFAEVEMTLTEEQAIREARRCLRCDLKFTQDQAGQAGCVAVGEETV